MGFGVQTVQCCEVCGLLAHEGCRGQVAASCRPVAVAAEALPHHWQPAGVVLDESEVRFYGVSHLQRSSPLSLGKLSHDAKALLNREAINLVHTCPNVAP